mmetsp:Transcript_94539/g.240505  ORF Transcript_94539/g.240505 Transcript_94539/m.240505 type:complete len:220 (+) Transcript_94539:47-706(+)
MKPTKAKNCAMPAVGTTERAFMPLGTSANCRFADVERKPGHLKYSGVMYPMVANIATRPCLSSISLRRLNFSTSRSLVKPSGSQRPRGGWSPTRPSKPFFGLSHSGSVLKPGSDFKLRKATTCFSAGRARAPATPFLSSPAAAKTPTIAAAGKAAEELEEEGTSDDDAAPAAEKCEARSAGPELGATKAEPPTRQVATAAKPAADVEDAIVNSKGFAQT